MSEKKLSDGWIRTLLGILVSMVMGFAGLCFWGYNDIRAQVSTETDKREKCLQDMKIEINTELKSINTEVKSISEKQAETTILLKQLLRNHR